MSASQASVETAFSIGDDHDDLRAEFDTDFETATADGYAGTYATAACSQNCGAGGSHSGGLGCCVDY